MKLRSFALALALAGSVSGFAQASTNKPHIKHGKRAKPMNVKKANRKAAKQLAKMRKKQG